MNLQSNLKGVQAVLSTVFLMLLAMSFTSVSADQTEQTWDEWQAIGKGYLARRKVPANFSKPVSERRHESVADRNIILGESLESLEKIGEFHQYVQAMTSGTSNSVWIKTQGEGVFSVPIAELVSLTGQTEASIIKKAQRRRLALTNGGQAVRWMYYPDTASIIFVGENFETFYTEQNAYHLTFARTPDSKRISISRDLDGPSSGVANSFSESLSFEEEPDLFFVKGPVVASEPDIDYWFWDYLSGNANFPRASIDVPLIIPNPELVGTAQIRINMRGATDLVDGNEHEVYATMNGQSIGSSIVWDGFTSVALEIDFDQSTLVDGLNTLGLHGVYDGVPSVQYLDDIEIDYQRMPTAEIGKLVLHDVQENTNQLVTGFTNDEILVIQNPNTEPYARRDVSIFEEVDGSFSVVFNTQEATEYLVTQVSGMLMADLLEEDIESTLASANNSVDYLIIAPRVFAGSANELESYRQNDFSNIKIAWLDDIYDEFSAGRVDPFALTRFLEYVNANWTVTPTNVVILGKGSLDHKDRMGYGDSFVPIVMTDTPWDLAASDDRLLAGEGIASFGIGRIPITSDAQGLAYVDKLRVYDSQATNPEKMTAVLIADNADEAGDFVANSEIVAQSLLDDYGFDSIQKEYHPSTPSVKSQMLLDATWETGLISYDGHGSVQQVGNSTEGFILAQNADDLSNSTYPIFAALTCAAGDFSMPGVTSLASALVLNPSGGAAVSYAPTGLSLDTQAQAMASEFFSSLYGSGNRMGKSVLDAKTNPGADTQLFMRKIYSVVGDPAAYAR